MRHRLDKLFKEKLADHAQVPPAGSWAKVEANLSKKNKGVVAYRMAAAVSLFGLLTWAIVWMYSNEGQRGSKQMSTVIEQKKIIPQKNQAEKKNTSEPKKQSPPLKVRKKSRLKPLAPVVAQRDTSLTIHPENQPRPEPVSLEQPAVASAPVIKETEKTFVLEYTLETIETKPPQEPTKLTAEVKEKKRLRKVLDFARDAKNSDGAVSELRQAKDEFLAFNFRKDKQKTSK